MGKEYSRVDIEQGAHALEEDVLLHPNVQLACADVMVEHHTLVGSNQLSLAVIIDTGIEATVGQGLLVSGNLVDDDALGENVGGGSGWLVHTTLKMLRPRTINYGTIPY